MSFKLNSNTVVNPATSFAANSIIGGTLSGGGTGVTSLNATQLVTGVVPVANMPAVSGGGSGSGSFTVNSLGFITGA